MVDRESIKKKTNQNSPYSPFFVSIPLSTPAALSTQIIEDKTFGLKNKNKSSKVQK